MSRKLNPDYMRRIMRKEEPRGLEAIYLICGAFGLSDEHPSGRERHLRRVKGDVFVLTTGNYKGWAVPGKLYCTRCWSPIVGIPREIVERNWCECCNSRLYPDDDKQLDRLGYGIYRDKVTRYMGFAARKFATLINGSEHILSNGTMEEGYQKDHIYSVRDGFENDIEEYVISSPPNIKVERETKNLSKGRRSACTLEELRERYERFLSNHPEWLKLVKESDGKQETLVYDGEAVP